MSFAKSTTVFCVVCNIQSTSADKILPPVQLTTLMLFLIFLTGLKSYTVCLFDLGLFFCVCVPYLWTVSRPVNSRLCVSEEPPLAVQNCSVPCKRQCPVSEWSSWSACLFDNCKDAEAKKGMRCNSQCLNICFILTTKVDNPSLYVVRMLLRSTSIQVCIIDASVRVRVTYAFVTVFPRCCTWSNCIWSSSSPPTAPQHVCLLQQHYRKLLWSLKLNVLVDFVVWLFGVVKRDTFTIRRC